METQDDSIDIAKVQRVVLGLENDQSQSLLNDPEPTHNTAQASESSRKNQKDLHSSNDRVSAAGQESLPQSSTPLPSRSTSHLNHATSPVNIQQPLPHPNRPTTTTLPRTGKMGSADTIPSDTQVVSQTVFDNIIQENKDAPENELDNNGEQATFMTMQEGDSGHIDLLAGFDSIPPDALNTEENDDQSSSKLGESSPLHFQPNFFPESQRFLRKTPATAVKQGIPDGLSSVTPCVSRNPLTADIESSGGIMALSQVFKATQAPSSPLVNHRNSDPMSDRPSPNLPIQNHPLATALSSPFNNVAATFPRDSSESNMNYITMKESQAQRDKILSERATRSADFINSGDHSDGEFDREPSFLERLRRKTMVDEETSAQLAGVTAPARPSSRSSKQAEKQTTSPPTDAMIRDSEDTPRITGLDDEPNAEFQIPPTSEEETEQEDLDQHVTRSQEPQSSAEEDKENHNNENTPVIPATASTHDRLSHALALQESPSRLSRASSRQPTSFHQHSQSPSRNDPVDEIGRSSQILVVKDSQQSPRPHDEVNHEEDRPTRSWVQDSLPQSNSHFQVEPSSDVEKIPSSPIKRPFRSSPPPPAPHRNPTFSQPASSRDISSQVPKTSSAPDGVRTQSSYPVSQRPPGVGNGQSGLDPQGKPSSMPSRIAETPVYQRPRSFGDVVPTTSIPETSPNRSQNPNWTADDDEVMNQEDDDLPPVYPVDHERASQSRPSGLDSSSPTKPPYNTTILSSPSGKQRRALTEIAADASPQAGNGPFDVDIGILTADDREFSSVVSMSPVNPRKKRRGNDGKNIYASDPILPATPRSTTPRFANPQENSDMAVREEPRRAESMSGAENIFQRRSKPSRRVETVWEVDESPEIHIPRFARSRKLATKRDREPQRIKAQRVVKDTTTTRPVDHNAPDTGQNAPPNPPQELPPTAEQEGVNNVPDKNHTTDNLAKARSAPSSNNVKIALNQVLAPWSGQKRAYYPATCFGTPIGVAQSRYVVRFEDSAPVQVPIGGVKRLELRIGDSVKVDIPNVPKVPHIIRGFDDQLSPEDLSQPVDGLLRMTDIYGNSTVILAPKQRKSLPNGGLMASESVIKVPISRIYLDSVLWNQLKDRTFTYSSGVMQSESRLQTPSNRHSTPASPGTRFSRSVQYLNGIFAGMVFSVTYSGNDAAKSRIMKMISENDGHVLEDGFNELFEFTSNVPFASPTKLPAPSEPGSAGGLRLTKNAEDVGFTCLIADQHSRSAKYMQALALNLPCLSARWVEDCIAQNRILDWEMYLLPAGESAYLHGAIKSRMLAPNPATSARLSETIAGRPNLLNGQSVLLVMGRGKSDYKKKAYPFLTYSLGASRVERVLDLESAKVILDQQKETGVARGWDWVYVHEYDDDAVRGMMLGAPAALSKKAQPSRSKKRKRDERMDSINGQDVGLSTNVRIVGDEFVLQSLILGKLFVG